MIAADPTWLADSEAAQDLWLAVACYAAEHGLLRESGRAFVLAADSPGPRSAQARALAGIQLTSSDRDTTRDLILRILRAREEGQTVLADVGLVALELPEGDARPVDVPPSLRDAQQDVIDADPFLLNFLAEAALRHRDYTEAVALRERAVAASGRQDSTYRITLAASLRRRAQSQPGSSGADLPSALGYAQEAVNERRRWKGPSADALGEVLDILTATGDMSAAITAALPESETGTALEAEAATEGVARRGAHAALASRNRQAYDIFMQLLPDGPYRRELQALDDDDQQRPRAERIAASERLISDPADDAMAARCAAALARLGTWPPQADELRARSILPEADYQALKAVCRAEAGETGLGIAQLRELSGTSALAAGELILLLERSAGPDAAISEAEQQAARWQHPPLQIQYVDLLGSNGRFPDAGAYIDRAIPDTTLPADVRLKLCAWCCPALKISILAALTTPMKNRAFRAVSWGRCRSTWARCRTQGRFSAVIAVCGQARAGNGAGGLAGRGHGQQPAAGQHVDPRPPASVLQPVASAEDQRRGPQVLQRGTQLLGAGPGQQLIMAGCQDGADARDAQLHGGPAGCADPAAHRAGRDGQAGGDGPVPVPASGRGQGLSDQPGGVGAARQQPGVQHHVGDAAAGAQRAVRADGQRRAAGVADGALAGVPPQPQRLVAARAAQHPAGQRDPGRRRVEDLDHRPSRQDRPGRLVRTRGSWCCSVPPCGGPRNPGRPARPVPAPGRRGDLPPARRSAGH